MREGEKDLFLYTKVFYVHIYESTNKDKLVFRRLGKMGVRFVSDRANSYTCASCNKFVTRESEIYKTTFEKNFFFNISNVDLASVVTLMEDGVYVRLCICANCPAILGRYIEFDSIHPELEGKYCIRFEQLNTIIN